MYLQILIRREHDFSKFAKDLSARLSVYVCVTKVLGQFYSKNNE